MPASPSSTARRLLGLAALFVASAYAVGPDSPQPDNNAAGVFRFAILPDRTGGNRPGVFENAIAKLQLLQPEFVMSVGDLIDGYTTDPQVITRQWAELDGQIGRLGMRFHYVAGNHDLSNATQRAAWIERHGPTWSSFVQANVLFLCLDTEDRPEGGLGDAQLQWVEQTLAANAGVRWTLVFLHRPLWRGADQKGFERVRAALHERPYTVFAGHEHSYLKSVVDGRNYYGLATAGGSSDVRGIEFGEFDHVTWVTMTAAGPVVANLALEGIVPDDIVTDATQARIAALRGGTWLHVPLLLQLAATVSRLEIPLEFRNPTDSPLRVRGSLARAAGVEFLPGRIDRVVPPQQTVTMAVQLKASSGTVALHALNEAHLELTLSGSYEIDGRTLTLPTTSALRFDWPHAVPAATAPVVLDGSLAEWPADAFVAVEHPMAVSEDWDWHGAADGKFRFAVQHREGRVFVAIETTDDRVLTGAAGELQDKLIVRVQSNAGAASLEGIAGTQREDAVVRATATGLVGEFSFALPADNAPFHLNIGWVDHDRPENTKPSVLWWRDPASGESGEFRVDANP